MKTRFAVGNWQRFSERKPSREATNDDSTWPLPFERTSTPAQHTDIFRLAAILQLCPTKYFLLEQYRSDCSSHHWSPKIKPNPSTRLSGNARHITCSAASNRRTQAAMTAPLPKRIIKETERLQSEPVPGISAHPHDDNARYFDVMVQGPDGSCYEGLSASPFYRSTASCI